MTETFNEFKETNEYRIPTGFVGIDQETDGLCKNRIMIIQSDNIDISRLFGFNIGIFILLNNNKSHINVIGNNLFFNIGLFKNIFDGAGIYRDYNFTKKEWVLNGDTVIYASFDTIKETLEYDFEQEKNFSYKGLSLEESIKHLCRFTSNIWQVHPFCEGNTRITAVFLIKYLRTFGFNINDEVFAENSWYFRNSLVRANYKNFEKNVFEDTSFLEKFFYNLLTNANYELKNRYTHIDNIQSANENNLKGNNCTLEEQAIINILKINPRATQEEIANQINKSVRTIKTYMAAMQEKGLIERKNSKKNGEWKIN